MAQTQDHEAALAALTADGPQRNAKCSKERRERKNDESAFHLPQRSQKGTFLFNVLFYRVFGRLFTRRVQKHEQIFSPTKTSGVIENTCFSLAFFSLLELFCSFVLPFWDVLS
jgi:hypothetical protein